jgi:hypothetical protein
LRALRQLKVIKELAGLISPFSALPRESWLFQGRRSCQEDERFATAARALDAIVAQSLVLIASRGAIHEPPMAAMSGSLR